MSGSKFFKTSLLLYLNLKDIVSAEALVLINSNGLLIFSIGGKFMIF